MDAREYLEQYEIAQGRADELRARYEELVAQYDCIGSSLGTEGVRRSEVSKPTERKVEKAQKAYEKWQLAALHAVDVRQQIYGTIMKLPIDEAEILALRFIELNTWEAIEAETGFCHSSVFRLCRHGLKLIQEELSKK
jgi:DNA-directed RNA polymerase specialized sigma subunit